MVACALVVGDVARIDEVRRLTDQAREHGPIDAWVHNAGVWVRGSTPRTSAEGHETTFAVNVLAPHLLTHLQSAELQGRLLWLGSGLAGSARPKHAALGRETDPRRPWLGILNGLPVGRLTHEPASRSNRRTTCVSEGFRHRIGLTRRRCCSHDVRRPPFLNWPGDV